MRHRLACLSAALLFIAAISAFGQDEGDPRIRKALDSRGIKYSVNSANNFKVVYTMESEPDRSQLVFIVSKTTEYKSLELREIWSVAAVLDAFPDPDVLERLFKMNSTSKIGAWAIEVSDEGEVWLMYTAKVLVDLAPKELTDIVYFVAEVCDELEAELVGGDEY
ncbi:MAG: hypothetical protein KKA67_11905 [Spirochaetes bacterium]|nr:hypothetical protein [Spirochaetota bacterium]MBU1081858.1 hypothetical protein [Spirochaetota bacterium]